jgi:OOP family OmpA-OmpF porin
MRTLPFALLLASTAFAPAFSEEVLMLENTPSVEELRSYLAPEATPARRTRGIEIVGQQQTQTARPAPAQTVSTMAPDPAPAPEPQQQMAPAPQQKATPEPTTIGYRVQFAYDSAEIMAESKPFLDQLGQVLQSEPGLALNVEGHTDAHGSDAYNITLSQRRAKAVQAYLSQTWQVAPERLTISGKGESEPLTSDPNAAENRRVQFKPL